ncbi:unnamed protein product [Peniophora sp. CBMAI 1063]|nr:unnamed protein product [Peniophora sp. CBMAI 1063]
MSTFATGHAALLCPLSAFRLALNDDLVVQDTTAIGHTAPALVGDLQPDYWRRICYVGRWLTFLAANLGYHSPIDPLLDPTRTRAIYLPPAHLQTTPIAHNFFAAVSVAETQSWMCFYVPANGTHTVIITNDGEIPRMFPSPALRTQNPSFDALNHCQDLVLVADSMAELFRAINRVDDELLARGLVGDHEGNTGLRRNAEWNLPHFVLAPWITDVANA